MKTSGPRFEVTCPAYTAGPFPSLESAERALAHIEQLGACMFDHEVREVAVTVAVP